MTTTQTDKRVVARWENRGNFWLELLHGPSGYSYRGDGCGGTMGREIATDEQAIAYMVRPWGQFGAGPVTVHMTATLKRVK